MRAPRGRSILTRARRLGHVTALASTLALVGCSSARSEFIGGRILQSCDQEWPGCDVIAGCLLGGESYTQGQLPGSNRVLVQLQQPSTVTLSQYLDQVGSVGTYFQLTWFEGGCRQRVDVKMTGQEMIAESEKQGALVRSNNLYDVGDHLIEFASDAQAAYLFKVEVTPLRNGLP